LVGFGREGFEHFVCSCHCIWYIGLSSPRRFDGESKKLSSSWVLGTLDGLVDFLGTSNQVVEIFPSFVVPRWRFLGASNWVVEIAPSYGFGDRPQVSHSGRVFHLGGRARWDYGEPPWCLGSLVPPHRSNGD
jgi:hypothetical protein